MRERRKICAAEDTGQAEHVLCLEEGTVTIAIDFDSEAVFAVLFQVVRDVESSSVSAVLAESDVLSINPKIEETIDAIEVEDDLTTFPVSRNSEVPAVAAHLVAIFVGRPALVFRFTHHAFPPIVLLYLMIENNELIDINRDAILHLAVFAESLNVPASRHLYVVPARDVV